MARKQGLSLSIEPYDMNPAGDLDLGAVADVPMAEFWDTRWVRHELQLFRVKPPSPT